MGGRGSYSGSSGNSAEKTLLSTSPIMRVKYKDLKEVGTLGRRAIDGTYDPETKTIEANIGRRLHALIDTMPNDYAKYLYGGQWGKSKLAAAVDFSNNVVTYGGIADKNAPAWARKAEEIVLQGRKLDDRYGIDHDTSLKQYRDMKKRGY